LFVQRKIYGMIITEYFTFVHLHKSGGSFISSFLLSFLPSARCIGYHYPLAVLPAEYRDLPVLGSVRNPWDVYVSYYFFQLELLEKARERNAMMSPRELEAWTAAGNDPFNGVDVLFEEMSKGGSLSFSATTRRILQLGVDSALLDQLLDKMPTTFDRRGRSTPPQVEGFRGMNVRADDLTTIRSTGQGLYSFLFRHLYGNARDIHFLRMESLREDLLAYLSIQGIKVTSEMESFVRRSDRVNTSRHRPYASYYDQELAALVRKRDSGTAQLFGYYFDWGASNS
jgi:hypothetical protein